MTHLRDPPRILRDFDHRLNSPANYLLLLSRILLFNPAALERAIRLEIVEIFDDETLRIWLHVGTNDSLVACFSGIGTQNEACQPYELASAATEGGANHVLYFSDKTRSWLNTDGLIEKIVGAIENYSEANGIQHIKTIGNSMGGFMAVAIAGYTKVDIALAFSPQMSVHPQIVPDETRWANYTGQISDYKVRDLSQSMSENTKYYAIHGAHPRERPQRDRFIRHPNMDHYILRGAHHNVAQVLKNKDKLSGIVWAVFNRKPRKIRIYLKEVRAFLRPSDQPADKGPE